MDCPDKSSNTSADNLSNELNSIFENAAVVLLLLDNDSRVMNINKAGIEMIGKKRENVLNLIGGQAFDCINAYANGEVVCGRGKNCSLCSIRNNVNKTFLTGETAYKNEGTLEIISNGKVLKLTILITTAIINTNNKKNVLLTIDDITELKLTEEKLKESEENLKKAQEIGRLGHWELDIVNDVLTWSDEIYRIFDLKPQEFDATYEAFLSNIHPEDRDKVNTAYVSSIENKLPYEIEHRLLLKSGKIKYVLESCQTEYDELGNPLRSIGTVSDITEMKEKENQLNEAIATKDKFFSIIAHDLKGPFGVLLGLIDILLEDHQKYDKEELDKIISVVDKSANSTFNLLENLLTWAQSQTGQIKFSPEKLYLNIVLFEAQSCLQQQAQNKNIQILEIVSDDEIVYADKNMITTVIRNLISNAIKFTNKNGSIVFEAKKQKENDFLEISVTDTGVGIPKDIIKDLFSVDRKYSTEGTENETGTGLGLILCKDFVEKHGGKIWIESVFGKGSSFKFTIPINKIQSDNNIGNS